jgi:hypothetical protein
MSYRPYFRLGIEQLETVFDTSEKELKKMKMLQYELGHRDRPRALALKRKVDEQVRILSVGQAPLSPIPPQPFEVPISNVALAGTRDSLGLDFPVLPERLTVECAYCDAVNFVSTLNETVQHLSCSSCKKPYEAIFKYGVMRTKFPPIENSGKINNASLKWIIAGIVLLIVLALALK